MADELVHIYIYKNRDSLKKRKKKKCEKNVLCNTLQTTTAAAAVIDLAQITIIYKTFISNNYIFEKSACPSSFIYIYIFFV